MKHSRSVLLAYSVGSTLGLFVGTVIGSTVVDEVQLHLRARKGK